jgi:hypothetical protein
MTGRSSRGQHCIDGQSSRSCVWATTGPPATRGPLDNRAPTRRYARRLLRLSDCFPCPNGLIWHVRQTDAGCSSWSAGARKPASIFRPRMSQGIRDQRRVGRAVKGRIRRDRRRQSGKRPVPPLAQPRNAGRPRPVPLALTFALEDARTPWPCPPGRTRAGTWR